MIRLALKKDTGEFTNPQDVLEAQVSLGNPNWPLKKRKKIN